MYILPIVQQKGSTSVYFTFLAVEEKDLQVELSDPIEAFEEVPMQWDV